MNKDVLFFFVKRCVEFAISSALFYSGFLRAYLRTKGRERIPILYYHEIADDTSILGDTAVRPEIFEMQMKHLARWYNPVSIDDVADYVDGKAELPANPVVVTFDGGYKGNYRNAYPVLKRYNIPATIYPVTGCIEKRQLVWTIRLRCIIEATRKTAFRLSLADLKMVFRLATLKEKSSATKKICAFLQDIVPNEQDKLIQKIADELEVDLTEVSDDMLLSWGEIVQMHKESSVSFGSHTITHPAMAKLPREVAAREATNSKSDIERKIGAEITSFCYPDGGFSKETKELVRETGYRTAISTICGLNDRKTDLYELKRIPGGKSPFECVFALNLAGILPRIQYYTRYVSKNWRRNT